MKTSSISEEDRILEVLKEFYQISHHNMKAYFLNKKEKYSGRLLKILQKLRSEDKIKSIQGLGQLYWRYNIPITTISKKQYRDPVKTIEAYVKQIEGKVRKI